MTEQASALRPRLQITAIFFYAALPVALFSAVFVKTI
jgi:hypothetical protein